MVNKDPWRRFATYEKVLTIFLLFSIFLTIVNKKLSAPLIPLDITSYLFWLSLGLYLGFRLCKYEFSNVLKKTQ